MFKYNIYKIKIYKKDYELTSLEKFFSKFFKISQQFGFDTWHSIVGNESLISYLFIKQLN